MNLTNVYICIAIMAAITFLTRVFPFLFFRNGKPPEVILFIGKFIPPTLLTILVIYCLKDIHFEKGPYGGNELLAVILVIILHLRLGNPLISIFGATLVYMFLIQSDILSRLI